MTRYLSGLLPYLLAQASNIVVSADEVDFGLPDWVNSMEGGYFNPKQEIRPEDPDNPDSMLGVFAKELIEEGELLNQVPWEAIISAEGAHQPDDDPESILVCGTTRNLAAHLWLGEKSRFGPYIQYLLSQPRGQLPSGWSDAGKALLIDLLGGQADDQILAPADPVSWLDEDWYGGCNGDPDDELAAHAALLVIQRADDEFMVPIYDLYNHRNGNYLNTNLHITDGVHHQVKARRTIEPGEQIHNSYNMCDDCAGRSEGYGTPEMLRDYGFVERYPQRWVFAEGELQFDLVERDDGNISLLWDAEFNPDETQLNDSKGSFRKELKRLRRVRNMAWNLGEYNHVPELEWKTIWEYHAAVIDAVSYAINDLVEEEEDKVPIRGASFDGTCSPDSYGDHYDDLDAEEDDLPYINPTCDNSETMKFMDYDLLETVKTTYQLMSFQERAEPSDICMDLDDTLQICSSYRPHYHEYSAHYAARFLDEVKRVVFVGGGDSMLLHEVLKYPTLEKVVGLELDQVVTRKSFKYFATQPHFDDQRVEWWFGDAIKSLLLLPKDYWGSFDLVLVDLSETVMAFTVTDNLDVFDALALLMKPEGVMVKNELYMADMSKIFDYSMQIDYKSPKICSQAMVLGSNRVDFLHHKMKDHNVETLLLPPLDKIHDRFEWMHDYRKNDARAQGACEEKKNLEETEVQDKSAGIILVADAEMTSGSMDLDMEALVYSIVTDAGLTPISTPSKDKDLVVVVMKEGYVVARMWPKEYYCAFDISLWGGFLKQTKLRDALTNAVGSAFVSSYRVVVGGMFGSSTWKEDQKLIGPQMAQNRNCEIKESKKGELIDELAVRVAINEAVNLVHNMWLKVAVLCGLEDTDECLSADVFENHNNVDYVLPIYACPDLFQDVDDKAVKVTKMYDCEKSVMAQLEAMKSKGIMLDMFVVDSSTPLEMGQILNSIWSMERHREAWIREHSVFLALTMEPGEEPWQRWFLDRYREHVAKDPIARAEIAIQASGKSMELGLVSHGDEFIFHNLYTVESKIYHRLAMDMDVDVEVRKINGGLTPFVENLKIHEYDQDDYDNEPGEEQYKQQRQLGRESIFQFGLGTKEGAAIPSSEQLNECLVKTLKKLRFATSRLNTYSDVGDGVVMVAVFAQGSAILTWDGQEHVDINLFHSNDRQELADSFASSFVHFSGKNLKIALRDDFPRGVGRVVNFRSDLTNQNTNSAILSKIKGLEKTKRFAVEE